METADVPKLKREVLKSRLTLAIEERTKQVFRILKEQHGVDHTEWIRQQINKGLPELLARYNIELE